MLSPLGLFGVFRVRVVVLVLVAVVRYFPLDVFLAGIVFWTSGVVLG